MREQTELIRGTVREEAEVEDLTLNNTRRTEEEREENETKYKDP